MGISLFTGQIIVISLCDMLPANSNFLEYWWKSPLNEATKVHLIKEMCVLDDLPIAGEPHQLHHFIDGNTYYLSFEICERLSNISFHLFEEFCII